MWIFTPLGFFSIVRKGDDRQVTASTPFAPGREAWDAGTLTVRARVREDLVRLRRAFNLNGAKRRKLEKIRRDGGVDYPFRMQVDARLLGGTVDRMTREITYDNFKDEVASRQGAERADVYSRVWALLLALEAGGKAPEATYRDRRDPLSPVTGQELSDLLLLVGEDVSVKTCDAWTQPQRNQVERWAAAVSLSASDNPVRVPARPRCLPAAS